MTDLPDPWDVLRASRRGREESVQQLLTMLIVEGAHPRWNSRSVPSERGAAFLAALFQHSFDEPPERPTVFVDELDLPRRHDGELAGSPDWAVLWPDRVWMVELKTERASHRPEQLPRYLSQSAHHYPGSRIDLTYLTGPLEKPAPTLLAGQRYRHVTWPDVLPLLRSVWATSDARASSYVDAVDQILSAVPESWTAWRSHHIDDPAPVVRGPISDDELVAVVEATARDGRQRAVDVEVGSPEELDELRLRARDLIERSPLAGSGRQLTPWRWVSTTSGGQALTDAGRTTGMELRISASRL